MASTSNFMKNVKPTSKFYGSDFMLFQTHPRVFKISYNLMKMMEIKRKYNFPSVLDQKKICTPWLHFMCTNKHVSVVSFYNMLRKDNLFFHVLNSPDLYEEYFAFLRKELKSFDEILYLQHINLFFKTQCYNFLD